MPIPTYQLECTRNKHIAHGVYEFACKKPDDFNFKAGQFVLFDVALIENPDDIQTRAFSIASAPHEHELLFVAKMKEGGRASRWIEEALKPGDLVRTQGPFGNFVCKEHAEKDYVFICTSTGIAPFRSQVLEMLEKGVNAKMDIIFGARTEADLFWEQEWMELSQEHENVHVHFTLTQPTAAWAGHRGRVQAVTPTIVQNLSNKAIYVCGSPDMTKDVKKICLEEWNIEKQNLHVEGYI